MKSVAGETKEAAGAPARRGAVFERDWTKGSILRNLWSLSWPMMLSNSVNMLGPTVDMIWVGRLGPDAIAGVGVAGAAVMLVMSMMMGLFIGLRAIVARFVGAGDVRSANHVAQQAFVIAAVVSIIMAAVGIFFAESILRLLGVQPEVVAQGAAYLRINFIGMVAMSFRFMTEGIMQASGDAMTPMKMAVFFRLFHVTLCPFLVFGWWLFPRLGVSGAALTNVFSQSLGTALGLWFLLTGRTRLWLSFRGFRLDFGMIWRVVKIGIPASIMGMTRNLAALVLMWIIAPFGTLAVAAFTLNQRFEMIFFMPAWGVGMAAGVLAGQNLGAKQPQRAEKSGWLAVGLVGGFMLAGSLVILLGAEGVVHVFTSAPGLVEIASIFLRIAAAGYLVMGFTVVLQQLISGVGDTLPPMLFALLTMWGVQIPLAYFLPRITALDVYGVPWAIVVSTVISASVYTMYFRLGSWKRKKV